MRSAPEVSRPETWAAPWRRRTSKSKYSGDFGGIGGGEAGGSGGDGEADGGGGGVGGAGGRKSQGAGSSHACVSAKRETPLNLLYRRALLQSEVVAIAVFPSMVSISVTLLMSHPTIPVWLKTNACSNIWFICSTLLVSHSPMCALKAWHLEHPAHLLTLLMSQPPMSTLKAAPHGTGCRCPPPCSCPSRRCPR